MFSKKIILLVLGLSLIIGIKISNIYVPDDFENPSLYKFSYFFLDIGCSLSKLAYKLNIGTEAYNFRYFMGFTKATVSNIDENVQVSDSKINGINVRIYKPIAATKTLRPLMIYYHGGGWVFGSVTAYDPYLFNFVKELEMVIVSVDYRLAPEHPYPAGIDDCYSVTLHVLKNPLEFGFESSKVVLAGDSAGGNAVAVITQRLLEQQQPLPKIQVLIYPWLQMANMHTHSAMFYRDQSMLTPTKISFAKFILWYLGINDVTDEMLDALESHNHTILIKDFEKYKKYWDVGKIPDQFKNGLSYYDEYEKRKELYPKHQLHDSNILVKDKNLNSLVQKLVDKDISPLLADNKYLIGLPKAYFLVLEWDTLKDEGLLYAERLKEAGIDVHLAFYDKAFHGIAGLVGSSFEMEIAKKMQTDLVKYLRVNL